MEVMYRVRFQYGMEITAHRVVKQTPKTVTYLQKSFGLGGEDKFSEVRESKESVGTMWFEEFSDAKNFAIARTQGKVDRLKQSTNDANSLLGSLRKLEKPAPITP